jgi:hypothetical protein
MDVYEPDISSQDFDWYWHCKLSPASHIGRFQMTICKLEEIDKLRYHLLNWFPKALDYEIPIDNATEVEYIDINPKTMNKIKMLFKNYAQRFEYEF